MQKHANSAPPPVLIALPHGLNVSGVTTWGVRLVNALAAEGRPVGLITHPEPAHQKRLELPIDPRVDHTAIADAPPMDRCNGDLTPFLPHYTGAIDRLRCASGQPVVFSPNLVGDCYAVGAAVASARPDLVRVVGWQHNDTEYDAFTLEHYQPLVCAFVGVSRHITDSLRTRLATRAEDVVNIPYGVEVPGAAPRRPALRNRPIRLLYTGRMDHFQKRIGVLPELSAALDDRGVDHELRLLGDGPAAGEVDERCATLPNCARTPGVGPAQVREALAWADVFVLTSRFEGLSVSMLEALAAGCAPVVARVQSGAAEAVEHAVNGLHVDAGEDDERIIAERFADAVEALTRDEALLRRLQDAAWRTARDRYSVAIHAQRAGELFDRVARHEPRAWPADRPCGFTSSVGVLADATVPTDAGVRMRRTLERIATVRPGARVALWGAGRHTIALAAELARPAAEIVCVLDDDASTHAGRLWGLPVVGAHALRQHGVTDVVISSWMHQQAIWDRREAVTSQGIETHRLYPSSVADAMLRPRPQVPGAIGAA